MWIEEGIQAGTITLRDISRFETAQTRGALVQLDRGAKIRRLVAEHIRQTLAPGVNAPLLLDAADVETRIETDIE